jgi:hypothetical protein
MFFKKDRKYLKLILALIVGGLFFITSELILIGQFENRRVSEHINITEKYLTVQQSVEYMMMDNINLIKGIAAYIQMNDTYSDDAIMELLEILYDDRLDEVRNGVSHRRQ